jgi:hypothetical protein
MLGTPAPTDPCGRFLPALALASEAVSRSSAWERDTASPGTLALADEPGWLAALAQHVSAIHFAAHDADSLWQALAGGSIVSAPTGTEAAYPQLASAVLTANDENDVIAAWLRLGTDSDLNQHAARAARQAYAAENRLAVANAAELIDRVCRWQ